VTIHHKLTRSASVTHGSAFAEQVRKHLLNLRNFAHHNLSEFVFVRPLRKLSLPKEPNSFVERTFRHIDHILDAHAKRAKVAKELCSVQQVLFDGLAYALIQVHMQRTVKLCCSRSSHFLIVKSCLNHGLGFGT
jgi:hypothetical protein